MTSEAGTASGPASALGALRAGLVVSCQAAAGHPLADSSTIAAIARCAENGGAAAVRVEGARDVRATHAALNIPVLGIAKVPVGRGRPFITPTFEHCEELVRAGADLLAIEAATEYRPDSAEFPALCARVRDELGVPVLADVSTLAEGRAAAEAGADLVATTLSGHTRASASHQTPDLELLTALVEAGIPAVLEGGVRRPDQVAEAFERGAWSVVVGTAITDPAALTSWYAARAPSGRRTPHGRSTPDAPAGRPTREGRGSDAVAGSNHEKES